VHYPLDYLKSRTLAQTSPPVFEWFHGPHSVVVTSRTHTITHKQQQCSIQGWQATLDEQYWIRNNSWLNIRY